MRYIISYTDSYNIYMRIYPRTVLDKNKAFIFKAIEFLLMSLSNLSLGDSGHSRTTKFTILLFILLT